MRRRVGALLVFAALFLLWEFAVHLFGIKEYLLPPPSKVWTEFLKRYTIVMPSAWVTLQEIVAGYLLAVVVSNASDYLGDGAYGQILVHHALPALLAGT